LCPGDYHHLSAFSASADRASTFVGGGKFSGTEIENNSPDGRDPFTRFNAAMPTEGPLTDAGLEVWPRGMYDLVTQISREYNHPIIEITESGCGYLDGPDEEENGRIPDGRRQISLGNITGCGERPVREEG
jgi:beta-glucosidase